MPPEDDVDADETGSTPDAGDAPDDEPEAGSTPDEGDDDDGDEQDDADDDAGDEDEDEDEADTDSGDDDKPEATAAAVDTEDPEDDPEWKNLSRKFAHIKNPRDRRAQIAKAYWGKAKYAKLQRLENQALRRRLRELESGKTTTKTEAQPHPDIVKADARIESLKVKDGEYQKRQAAAVDKVNETDRQLAIAKHELNRIHPNEDEEGDKKRLGERHVRDCERELESATDRYRTIVEDRNELREKMEAAQADRDWIEQFQTEQVSRQKNEQTTREQFNQEFPQQVDRLILKAAKGIGINTKEDKQLRRSLIRNVNRALILELGASGDTDLAKVDLAGMVKGFVREYAIDRDLVKRKNFTRASREKLAAVQPGRTGERKAPTSSPARPAGSNKPVPVSLMGGDPTDKMAAARQRLVQRFG